MKRIKGLLALALVLTFVPLGTGVYAQETTPESVVEGVKTEAELLEAIAQQKSEINLAGDIDVTQKINIEYPLTINGNGFTLKGNDQEKWQGFYILHVYRTSVVLKDITLTGGDAGLLVNGSTVTLEGVVDVSNNEFGGIEVSKGEDVVEAPLLVINGELKNSSEDTGKPTIWLDKITEGVRGGFFDTIVAKDGTQIHYFFKKVTEPETALVTTTEEFLNAVAAQEEHITLANDITVSTKIDIEHDVVIDGNNHTIFGTDEAGWKSHYGIQFYNVTATVKNLNFSKLDAGLLINGSNVTLEGTINLSGNEFGGIELTQGEDVTTAPVLNIENAKLINNTEDYAQPTLWTDNTVDAQVIGGNLYVRNDIVYNQTQYYLVAQTEKEIEANAQFIEMLDDIDAPGYKVNINEDTKSVQILKLEGDFEYEEAKDIITQMLLDNDSIRTLTLGSVTASFVTAPSDNPENTKDIVNRLFHFNFVANRSNSDVDFLDKPVAFGLGIDVAGTLVKTEELTLVFNQKDGNGTVTPEVPTDGKETPKEDSKTPNTGIQSNIIMYASLATLGGIALVVLKKRKRIQ